VVAVGAAEVFEEKDLELEKTFGNVEEEGWEVAVGICRIVWVVDLKASGGDQNCERVLAAGYASFVDETFRLCEEAYHENQ